MELTNLINTFKNQFHLEDKCLAVFGEGASSIPEMELAIQNGFTSDNLVFGSYSKLSEEWDYAHVEPTGNGGFIISADTPHTSVKDVIVNCENEIIDAVSCVLIQLNETGNC